MDRQSQTFWKLLVKTYSRSWAGLYIYGDFSMIASDDDDDFLIARDVHKFDDDDVSFKIVIKWHDHRL